jgi:hypothetical protein
MHQKQASACNQSTCLGKEDFLKHITLPNATIAVVIHSKNFIFLKFLTTLEHTCNESEYVHATIE